MNYLEVLGVAAVVWTLTMLMTAILAAAAYLTAAWLRSRRKRTRVWSPNPYLRPRGAREIAMVEQAHKDGYTRGVLACTPSSPPTPGRPGRPSA